ncbi:helix-turn-helix transcriptional regulator [Natrarchaeobaculum aegyptiacum]|uniref:HTH iclR-type domain-containing protein n=1 Tax=Natrarchaeobaculum aegyptiacum TaxID=745377 RepID=A0A2Z2HND6_9EURY|nr:hypothetical protein [Natrarchaeobaculum aegyptiacum]ARS88410.1 hypothetical protein B1756_00670 [Natrarchaeobaculum aegyptiacum]
MTRPLSVVFVVLLLSVGLVGSGMAGTVGADEGVSPAASSTPVQASPSWSTPNEIDAGDFDTTSFEITVHENGSATWTFRYEQRLEPDENGDERDHFESFAETFEEEETGMYVQFTEQAHAMVDRTDGVSEEREMEATNFNRSASVERQFNPMGVVEMSFTWHGFAEIDDENDRIVVSDVFENIYLTDRQSIVITAGDGLAFQHAEPDPSYVGQSLEDADSVQWSGEQEFLDGHPYVVLERSEPDSSIGVPSVSANGTLEDGVVSWPVVAAIVLAVGLVLGAVWYRYRDVIVEDQRDPEVGPGPDRNTSSTADLGSESSRSSNHDADGRGDTDPVPERASGSPGGPLPDDELLSDEDRVVSLIKDNGGRMKQVNIVEETGWSKSKVSMLLSDMEDDGTISKLRVGRENIISLEGFEPEATRSPFEE